jgi:PAS domain S-box-containing protein
LIDYAISRIGEQAGIVSAALCRDARSIASNRIENVDSAVSTFTRTIARPGKLLLALAFCWTMIIAALALWTYKEVHFKQVASVKSIEEIPRNAEDASISRVPLLLCQYGGIWMLGIVGLAIFRHRLLAYLAEIERTEKALKESTEFKCAMMERANYETFFNRIDEFLFVLDEEGNVLHVNAAVVNRLGFEEEELLGKSVLTVHPPELRKEAEGGLVAILSGETNICTVPLGTKTGEWIPVETKVTGGFWNGKAAFFGVCKDMTQVRRSEQMFSRAFHLSSVMMVLSRIDDGTFIDANDTVLDATGYTRADLIDGRTKAAALYADPEQRKEIVDRIRSEGCVKEMEVAFRLKNGSIKNCIVSSNPIYVGNDPCMVSVIVDITHQKITERRQNLMAEVLEILNAPSVTTDAIDQVLVAIQRSMDLDAVGIRLKQGDDFPYFFQKGFSNEFLAKENTLIPNGDSLGFCGDQEGDISRECTCGLVIAGMNDKQSPFFTTGGSFWTNDLSAMLRLPAEKDPRLHPRNRCIREGFQSMAIIPIHANREIVGLLQLNYRTKDRFTADEIQFFEGIAESIGVALVRKQTEDALRESEEKFRRHVENSFDVIFTIDKKGYFLFLSPAWERHFGYTVSDTLGKTFQPYLHPDDVLSCVRYVERIFISGQAETSPPFRVKCADGSWRWFEANGTRFTDAEGEMQFIGVGRDINERKHAEEQMQNDATALEASNRALEEYIKIAEAGTRAKSEFLANMSHEIRTPMTAILGCADLLINEKGLEKAPPHRRQNIETIKRNGQHLLALLNDILDLSKMEAGKMKLGLDRSSPFELVGEVISLMRVRAEEKQLKLEADLSEPLPETIQTDPLRLRQMLINLTGNAIKFTDCGSIRIAARLVEHEGKTRIRFDVIDTGIGMNEEQVKNLFRAFSQVDNSATRKYTGTGLGLCICKRLAEAMGGNIEVQSNPGKGSTFSFSIDPGPLENIPMIQNNQSVEFKPIAASENTGKFERRYHILVAEDGPDNQRLIRIILEDAGAGVKTVENGQLAFESVLAAIEKKEPFDVILMDMQMPIMDGYTATRKLREQGYSKPIIALTAHAMADDRQKCLDAGCDDFVTKPIDWEKLLSTIAGWASGERSPASAKHNAETLDPANAPEEELHSLYADKPVIARVLPNFVDGLEGRVQEMNAALAEERFDDLRRLAHQLKGAGGSYGYPTITTAAVTLEADARENRGEAAKASLAKLAATCRAAIRGFKKQTNHAVAQTTT